MNVNVDLSSLVKGKSHTIKVRNLASLNDVRSYFDSEVATTDVKWGNGQWEITSALTGPPQHEEPMDEDGISDEGNKEDGNSEVQQLPESMPEPEEKVHVIPSLMDKAKTYTIEIQGIADKKSEYKNSQAAPITMEYVNGRLENERPA